MKAILTDVKTFKIKGNVVRDNSTALSKKWKKAINRLGIKWSAVVKYHLIKDN